jgi:hypothetical protein
MVKRRGPPSQGWKTFLHNHADGIAATDLFVVPISFRLLYGLLIMGHGRRQILWFGVTANPTAEWIANQVTEACGWEQAEAGPTNQGGGLSGRCRKALWATISKKAMMIPNGIIPTTNITRIVASIEPASRESI